MGEENTKNKYITEEYLDKRLIENNQVVLDAVDSILVRRLGGTEANLGKKIQGVKEELKEVKEELKTDINNVQILIDGYVKAQEDFKQGFIIMKEEFKQIKKVLKEKLGVEIGAMM